MIIALLTLFPDSITPYLNASILKKAQEKNLVSFDVINIRDFANNKHKQVDDHPYGGGIGMILKIDILQKAIATQMKKNLSTHPKKRVILLDPRGKQFTQQKAQKLANSYHHLIFVCGHYEGIDERIYEYIDEAVSIGDYIVTGGELPALVIADSVTRLIPGVLDTKATKDESYDDREEGSHLAYPQYTRPQIYKNKKVPPVLLSGDHKKIDKWRSDQSLKITKKLRPDLLTK